MALTWVTSLGGPLILVPESACHHWHGASNAFPEDDYGRACAVNDYIGLIDVGPTRVMLHDDPAATTFLPQYGVLVRTVAINPDVDVVAAVAEALPSVAWEAPLLWLVGEPLILFDSVYHNAEVQPDQRLRLNLVPGSYVVQAAYVELAGAHLILVRFARQPDGGCLGRHPASVLVDVDLDAASVGGPGGLLERLGALRDPRSRHGRRHALGGLLAIAAAAVLAGARSYTAIAEFAGEVPQATLTRLGIFRRPYSNWYVTPSERTLRRVLQQVDAGELDRVVGGWLAEQQSASATGERDAVAVDGKTVRGAVGPDGRQVHLFAAIVHGHGTVIAQRQVDTKTNEVTQFAPLLDQVDLAGRVVTADALHTQTNHARYLVCDRHADYLFTVKGNQPGLETAISRLPPDAFPPPHTETDRGHGRIEQRSLQTAPVPATVRFPCARQVLVLQRHTTDLAGRTLRTEVAYGITSLDAARADPGRLAALARGHWQIEDRLHWVRDVTFDEDRSQIRVGHGPQVMASLRNLAISLLRLAGHGNIARGVRWAGRDPTRAFGLLGV